jgi:hypothetical protein
MMSDKAPAQVKRTLAVRLLQRILNASHFDIGDVAAGLVVDERTVGRYLAGEITMPLDRQLCLARLVIENIPDLARSGRNLLSQVQAQYEFGRSRTVLHGIAPLSNTRAFTRRL